MENNVLLTIVRLVVPLTILKWPFAGTLASALIDLKDWEWFRFTTAADYAFYDRWDKLLDLYYLSFAAYAVRFWKDHLARRISLALYAYRALGTVLFILIQSQAILFIFPNLFENLFLFYVAYVRLSKNEKLFSTFARSALVLLAVGIPKIVQEYVMHVVKSGRFFDQLLVVAGISLAYSFAFRMILYLCIPVTVLMWLVLRTRRT